MVFSWVASNRNRIEFRKAKQNAFKLSFHYLNFLADKSAFAERLPNAMPYYCWSVFEKSEPIRNKNCWLDCSRFVQFDQCDTARQCLSSQHFSLKNFKTKIKQKSKLNWDRCENSKLGKLELESQNLENRKLKSQNVVQCSDTNRRNSSNGNRTKPNFNFQGRTTDISIQLIVMKQSGFQFSKLY